MRQEFFKQPEKFEEEWPGELTSFSWVDFLTAIPCTNISYNYI